MEKLLILSSVEFFTIFPSTRKVFIFARKRSILIGFHVKWEIFIFTEIDFQWRNFPRLNPLEQNNHVRPRWNEIISKSFPDFPCLNEFYLTALCGYNFKENVLHLTQIHFIIMLHNVYAHIYKIEEFCIWTCSYLMTKKENWNVFGYVENTKKLFRYFLGKKAFLLLANYCELIFTFQTSLDTIKSPLRHLRKTVMFTLDYQ